MSWDPRIHSNKSDRYDERNLVKFVTVPRSWDPPRWTTYNETYHVLKNFDVTYTPHSLRRTASTALADLGYSFQQIQKLTGHTPREDPELAVRRYVDPSANQPE
ncbi:MAG: tyrosine-type recombinase/integrase, partial [Propionibacteriaceae bacterium]|nr:tyrosine-type recombinase/integrase [Propionibacteriaceae bacterium]